MTDENNSQQLDRADTRVRYDEGISGALRDLIDRTRSGDLGILPVLVGLILISVVFTLLNPVFLAPINLANLLFDASAVGFIALGIIFVLLLGEIDLSVGSMSGLASAMIGVLWVETGLPLPLAIVGALAAGALVGLLFGLLRNRFDMPSFVGRNDCGQCKRRTWVWLRSYFSSIRKRLPGCTAYPKRKNCH